MDHQIYKIHNEEDFSRITKGIKVAQCMQSRSSTVPDMDTAPNLLEDLVVSNSLSCSFCNTIFEDKAQQRLHYKLDWHRYNLKQRLNGLRSISEDAFSLLVDKGDVSSLSGTDTETENEDETATSETGGGSPSCHPKSKEWNKSKRQEKREKTVIEFISDSSDTECNEELTKERKIQALLTVASRHPKVFFENDDGNIFSIYRCLLHNKKEIPEVENEIIAQALNSGKETIWTIVMVGGGHFAAAVYQDGKTVVHKTFHTYTVRARQGTAQSTRDIRTMGSHPKSAGASLRRYNDAALTQHVQDILISWMTHIDNSSLILYRAVGPHNRTVLFGGKNPPLDKTDSRLRPIPFPTRRARFSEVQRVYDILSTMEIYGSAADFTDCFPISPRQPIRKRTSKCELLNEIEVKTDDGPEITNGMEEGSATSVTKLEDLETCEVQAQSPLERQQRNSRTNIDRAKPRKSPKRPLPDIVTRLAQSSSDSESDSKDGSPTTADVSLIEHECEVNFKETLSCFWSSSPRNMKKKKAFRQKRKSKGPHIDDPVMWELLSNGKANLWTACKLGDCEALSTALSSLLTEVKQSEGIVRKSQPEDCKVDGNTGPEAEWITQLLNDCNEDGNTMLHVTAIGGYAKLIWTLLEAGADPCNKNRKLQTPYAAATDKETRNTFRRFMGANPDKYNYNKSQIPGPLNDEIEQEESEKKRQQRKMKREKEKTKKKEFELKKREEQAKQRFLDLSDKEKRALVAEDRSSTRSGQTPRCFQCGVDMTNKAPFEYNANRFCTMPCLKEHRLRNKYAI